MSAVQAYVLVQTEPDRAVAAAGEIGRLDGVVSAEIITGPYDIIARIEAADMDDVGRLVVSQIQMIAGITRTTTCPVVHI
jgi:DNA-binding Lrp family transcriptional regulator